MKRKTIGICDTEKNYVEAFVHFFQRREGMRFDVQGFSRSDILIDALSEKKLDFVYITEEFMEDTPELEVLLPEEGSVILNDRGGTSHGHRAVDRYIPAQDLVDVAVRFLCPDEETGGPDEGTAARVIGIFSPVGRCGKTQLSLALGKAYSGKGNTLCMSLDAITGNEEFMPSEGKPGVSDLIYLSSAGGDIRELQCHGEGGLSILSGSSCPEDIVTSAPGVLESAVCAIRDKENYRYIVLDIGGDTPEPGELLNICDDVIMPVPDDEISGRKADNWSKLYGERAGEKIHRMIPPLRRDMNLWAGKYADGHC